MFIKQISKKQITTKFGQKEKWNFQAEDGKWYDAWVGNWNKDWKDGDTIEVTPDRIKSREYNGKTYYSIDAPPESRMGGKINLEPVMDALRKIYVKVDRIEKNQDFLKAYINGKQQAQEMIVDESGADEIMNSPEFKEVFGD